MEFPRWSRLTALLSLVALLIEATVPLASCACGSSRAMWPLVSHDESCGGEPKVQVQSERHACCEPQHSRGQLCSCDVARSKSFIASDLAAARARFDVPAILPTRPTLRVQSRTVVNAFAPVSHGPPRAAVAHLRPARAPPALALPI